MSSLLDRVPIKGYPGYFITETGDVWSTKVRCEMRLLKRWLCKGYWMVSIQNSERRLNAKIHRLLVEYFKPDIWNPELHVNHKDGVKTNNSIGNLEMVTNRENVIHAAKLGLNKFAHGSKSNLATIDEATAKIIKEYLKTNKASVVARMLDISYNVVRYIANGRTWRYV